MLHFVRAATTAAILRQRGCAIAAIFSIFSAVNMSAAAAATANFSGTSSGSFGLPEIGSERDPNPTFSVESTAPGSTTFTFGQPGESSRPSQLTFAQTSFTDIENEPFSIGEISFFNGQTFDGTNVSGVPLNIELILDSVSQPYQFQYQFNFDLTLNDTANYDSDADIVAVIDRTQTQSFSFEQETYELTLLGFSQDERNTFDQSLLAFEDRAVTSTLFAQIKLAAINEANNPATDIPEPSPLAASLAFVGTLLIKRRVT